MDLSEILDAHEAGFEITIEAFEGKNAGGANVYSAEVQVSPVWVDERRRVIRANTGETLTLTATVYANLDTVCPINSRVTLPSGRIGLALTIAEHDGGGFDVPEHLEIGIQ